jgi:hypothetical protein
MCRSGNSLYPLARRPDDVEPLCMAGRELQRVHLPSALDNERSKAIKQPSDVPLATALERSATSASTMERWRRFSGQLYEAELA